MKVGVIDYGSGNLGSVLRALENLGTNADLIEDPSRLADYRAAILPGVGNFTSSMNDLHQRGWVDALRDWVAGGKTDLLGICVGMQLLADFGDEGAGAEGPTKGLGLIRGTVRHLASFGCTERVPHVGWNSIQHSGDPLFRGIRPGTDFYFVHSYAMDVVQEDDLIAEVHYGARLPTAVRSGRVYGTQFHPEKSGRAGHALLRNFLELATWSR